MSTSPTKAAAAAGPSASPAAEAARPPRRRRKAGRSPGAARGRWMAAKVSEAAWTRLDGRAERAGLALGAWAGLLAEEVALGRPAPREAQVGAVVDARVRVNRVGGLVNQLAVGEHVDRRTTAAELGAVLERVAGRVAEARSALDDVGSLFTADLPSPTIAAAAAAAASGRRAATGGENRRGRRVLARLTGTEYDRIAAAAAVDGLSVGAWLGRLLEDPQASRPLLREAWRAVFALHKALRRVGTNLAQIEAARAGRGDGGDEQLTRVRAQVDEAIRGCLDVCAAIYAASQAGAA